MVQVCKHVSIKRRHETMASDKTAGGVLKHSSVPVSSAYTPQLRAIERRRGRETGQKKEVLRAVEDEVYVMIVFHHFACGRGPELRIWRQEVHNHASIIIRKQRKIAR